MGIMAKFIVLFLTLAVLSVTIYFMYPPSSTKKLTQDPMFLKRVRMVEKFIQDCRLDQYPEWRCIVFAKHAGFTQEEITKWSNE